jgi:hypothetical protein
MKGWAELSPQAEAFYQRLFGDGDASQNAAGDTTSPPGTAQNGKTVK